jgi:hypothetical protein
MPRFFAGSPLKFCGLIRRRRNSFWLRRFPTATEKAPSARRNDRFGLLRSLRPGLLLGSRVLGVLTAYGQLLAQRHPMSSTSGLSGRRLRGVRWLLE